MLTLPPARLSYVKSFGVVAGLSLSVLGLVCQQFVLGRWPVLFHIAALIMVGAALYYPNALYRPYLLYNLLAKSLTHYCSIAVSGVCFYCIFATVGRRKAKFDLERPEAGKGWWATRKPYPHETYGSQFSLPLMGNRQDLLGWTLEFCSWGLKSKNFWVYCLLPFLALLFLLSEGKDTEVPSDLYTLF